MFLAALAAVAFAPPTIDLIGTASLPATARDQSNLSELLAGEFPHDRLGSFGSGIDYTGKDDVYIACADRGPLDGATRWRPRVQTLRIRLNPGSTAPVEIENTGTTLLSDESGTPLTGFYGRFDAVDQAKGLRFDAEGVRMAEDGTFWLSDEYGPWIDRFDSSGARVQRVTIPAKFLLDRLSQDPLQELPPASLKGRQTNRGFEGLARSPDGTRLWAILQSPLIQDGALDEKGKRAGLNVRILEVVVSGERSGDARELVYQLEKGSNGVSEIVALNDHEFLVLERDGEAGREATWRRVYTIDITKATDVSAVDSLPREDLPKTIVPVTKSKWLDFAEERFGLAGPGMPEKIEGLALGPTLADGRRTLVVTIDNDLREDVPSTVWVFAWNP
jgi:hypothetical protein